MKNALRYYLDEQLVTVFYFPSDVEGKIQGFVIFCGDEVKPFVKMATDGKTLTVEGSPYPIDAEFYAEYGTECKDINDAYKKAKQFRTINTLWPPSKKS